MAEILKGAPVSAQLNEQMISDIDELRVRGISPTLAFVRIGLREADLTYERNAVKRCEKVGVSVRKEVLGVREENGTLADVSGDVSPDEVYDTINRLAADPSVHGIFVFRPLPGHIDDTKVRRLIPPEKDVDGCTDSSLAGVFTGTELGFAPCTAEAVMRILDYYNIDPAGKRAVILGRSLVIGRPAAMMLMHRQATPTICHTRTPNVSEIARQADILVVCSGKAESVDEAFVRAGQIVIDVGINWSEEKQKLCGDVLFDSVEPIVSAITPVPGGVGGVTAGVLVSHVVEAAKRRLRQ